MRSVCKAAIGALVLGQTTSALRTSLNGVSQSIGYVLDEQTRVSLQSKEELLSLLYPAHNLSVPIDHFHNESRYEPHTNKTFPLRFWYDASYYQRGGPVYVLQGGETSGADRLPFLQKGLLHKLAKATNGIGVVLEHRYYGSSFPTPDLSTENLRFLTTEQALADEAYFAQNVQFPGLEHFGDLTSKSVPYIGYGGSYAGAFNAFLRVVYPDVFWGAISSSGVTKAIYDYWQYWDPIIEFGPADCIATQQAFVDVIDNIIIGKNDTALNNQVKELFGMSDVTHMADVVSALSNILGSWQAQNWDPAVSTRRFQQYCDNITTTDILYPATESRYSAAVKVIQGGGYAANTTFVNQLLNYVGFINATEVAPCAARGKTQEQCFGNHDAKQYQRDSLADTWRAWPYQYCTEWGYLQTGSGTPANQKPIRSRAVDIAQEMLVCNHAFNITSPPELDRINKFGGYDLSYPRLAIVDGDRDPWRPATPHAYDFGAKNRSSTVSEPFLLIANAIHHFDENGLFANETTADLPPGPIREVQSLELEFIEQWLDEWKAQNLHYKSDL